MPQFRLQKSATVGGLAFASVVTIDGVAAIPVSTELAAAKTGTLTTRTDDNTGELTLASGHGVTTGQRIDVYWAAGKRYGMTVGTVASLVVPVDGGAGDNLPIATTAITAQVPTEIPFSVVGNDLQALAAYATRRSMVTLADGSSNHLNVELVPDDPDQIYTWTEDDGTTNPVAGDTLTKTFLSNGSSDGTSLVNLAGLYS
jgi:hypothetical protein